MVNRGIDGTGCRGMIDEKKLIEAIENLPIVHGRFKMEDEDSPFFEGFVKGAETIHRMVLELIRLQTVERVVDLEELMMFIKSQLNKQNIQCCIKVLAEENDKSTM